MINFALFFSSPLTITVKCKSCHSSLSSVASLYLISGLIVFKSFFKQYTFLNLDLPKGLFHMGSSFIICLTMDISCITIDNKQPISRWVFILFLYFNSFSCFRLQQIGKRTYYLVINNYNNNRSKELHLKYFRIRTIFSKFNH